MKKESWKIDGIIKSYPISITIPKKKNLKMLFAVLPGYIKSVIKMRGMRTKGTNFITFLNVIYNVESLNSQRRENEVKRRRGTFRQILEKDPNAFVRGSYLTELYKLHFANCTPHKILCKYLIFDWGQNEQEDERGGGGQTKLQYSLVIATV